MKSAYGNAVGGVWYLAGAADVRESAAAGARLLPPRPARAMVRHPAFVSRYSALRVLLSNVL